MNNTKINLQIESRKNKDGKGLLYLNFNYGYHQEDFRTSTKKYKPLKFSTGYRINKEDLNNGQITRKYINSNGKGILNDISDIEKACDTCLKEYQQKNSMLPSPQILKEKVKLELNGEPTCYEDDSIINFIHKLIESSKNIPSTSNDYLSPKSLVECTNTMKKLTQIENGNGVQLTFLSFTKEKYFESLKAINDNKIKSQIDLIEDATGYSTNYISKISKNILAILNKAKDEGIKVQFATIGKKVKEVASKCNTYITDSELKLIIESNVMHSKTLQSAKEYIIISSLTGLRLDDMRNLYSIEIKFFGKNEKSFLGLETLIRKVSKPTEPIYSVIPAFKPILDIYENNNNSFPRFQSNISKYIKKLCKHLNMDDEVEEKILYYLEVEPRTTIKPKHDMLNAHKCRNSFVTNLTLLGISRVLISEFTHPKKDLHNMHQVYNNSSKVDTAFLLIQQIKNLPEQSEVYYF